MQMQSAAAGTDERSACWTHWEQALAEVVVESMCQVGKASYIPVEGQTCVYIDGTLATNCAQSDRPHAQFGLAQTAKLGALAPVTRYSASAWLQPICIA